MCLHVCSVAQHINIVALGTSARPALFVTQLTMDMAFAERCDYVCQVVNNELERTVMLVCSILSSMRGGAVLDHHRLPYTDTLVLVWNLCGGAIHIPVLPISTLL